MNDLRKAAQAALQLLDDLQGGRWNHTHAERVREQLRQALLRDRSDLQDDVPTQIKEGTL